MPKISVIVPVYNVELYLNRCVDSILGQSFSDFELILVDDGSPDNCGAMCDAYQLQDSRVRVIHQKNGGLSAARNAGIDWAFANSDSDWLTFIDSDDWIHKDFLMQLITSAEEHGVDFSLCGTYWTDSFVEDMPIDNISGQLMDAEDLFVQHYEKTTSACDKLVKKHLFSGIRFPVGKLYEDAFVTHKLLFACSQAVVIDKKLSYYYNNPTSITHAKWSDKMLDSITAHESRLDFFDQKGFLRAHRLEQKIYIEELTFKIMTLLETRENPDAYQDSLCLMQNKLRVALKRARKDKAISMNRELAWSYLFAMPSDCFWKAAMGARSFYHKLKN